MNTLPGNVDILLPQARAEWVDQRDRSRRGRADPTYETKNPHPNYHEFGRAQFVDQLGRQYRIAKQGEGVRAARGEIVPDISDTQLLYVRLPIRKGGSSLAQPQPGDRLILYQLRTQRSGHALVEESYFSARAATGTIRVRHFVLGNPVADPSQWKHLLPRGGLSRRGKRDALPT